MSAASPLIITITRQIGSGGAYIGRILAEKLDLRYADRVILREAATQMSVLEEELEDIEEKRRSFWQSFLEHSAFTARGYIPPELVFAPRDRDLFDTESRIIVNLAKEGGAVVVGRCGFHILRDFPNHVKIFLHGDPVSRITRVQQIYKTTREEAERMIHQVDSARDAYCRSFTGQDRTDGRNYHLSIDTSKLAFDETTELILDYLKRREMIS